MTRGPSIPNKAYDLKKNFTVPPANDSMKFFGQSSADG
jgi:hypothetical protein